MDRGNDGNLRIRNTNSGASRERPSPNGLSGRTIAKVGLLHPLRTGESGHAPNENARRQGWRSDHVQQ